jgi:hypothetical protein
LEQARKFLDMAEKSLKEMDMEAFMVNIGLAGRRIEQAALAISRARLIRVPLLIIRIMRLVALAVFVALAGYRYKIRKRRRAR